MSDDYMTALRLRTKLKHVARRQGWTEDGCFVLGQEYMMPDKNILGIPEVNTTFKHQGSIGHWSAVTACLADRGMAPEAFTLLLAFASPLLKLCNLGGVMVLPYGKTRSGKTMLTNWMMSVWGDPNMLSAPPGDDIGTRFDMYNRHGNLPVVIDGAANYFGVGDIMKLSNDFSRGAGRVSINPGDPTLGRINQWSSVLVATGFDGLYRRMVNNFRTKQPAHSPILEYEIGKFSDFTNAAVDVNRVMHSDFGCIGHEYAMYLVMNKYAIERDLKEWITATKDQCVDVEGYDNIIALIGCVAVGGMIAEQLGLIRFTPIFAVNFAISQLQDISRVMKKYQNRTLVSRDRRKRSKPKKASATPSEKST